MRRRSSKQIASPRALDTRAARLVAADLLARRAWTRADLATRLRRRGAPPEIAAGVVDDLTSRGYLDDDAFARQWVESRGRRGYGRARLRAELRTRGISVTIIDQALATLSADGDLDRARTAARRRLPALLRARRDRAPSRLRDYLMRRGFSAGVIARVVRDLTGTDAPVEIDE